MICLICGKDFNSIACHVKKHGMTAKEYRIKFDIPLKYAIEEKHIKNNREKNSKNCTTKEHMAKIHDLAMQKIRGVKFVAPDMPETSKKARDEGMSKAAKIWSNKRKNITLSNATLLSDYKRGMSFSELSVKHNINLGTIRLYLGKNKQGLYRQAKNVVIRKAIEEHSAGAHCRDIAIKHGVNLTTVQSWVYRKKIK